MRRNTQTQGEDKNWFCVFSFSLFFLAHKPEDHHLVCSCSHIVCVVIVSASFYLSLFIWWSKYKVRVSPERLWRYQWLSSDLCFVLFVICYIVLKSVSYLYLIGWAFAGHDVSSSGPPSSSCFPFLPSFVSSSPSHSFPLFFLFPFPSPLVLFV